MIDPNQLAEMAKRVQIIFKRDMPHTYRPSDLYAGRCDYSPLTLAGACGRKRSHPLHRG